MSISNYYDVIDSRDIIERIEELQVLIAEESTDADFLEWCKEFDALTSLAEEAEKYSDDWQYGAQLIRESYFEIYMDEMIADCYELPEDLPFWMTVVYDYEALKQDYTEIDFDGVTYYIR